MKLLLAFFQWLLLALLAPGIAAAQENSQVTNATPSPTFSTESNPHYNVSLEKTQSRFNLGFYTQFSQFQRQTTSFFGPSFEVLAAYALTEKIGVNLSLTQSLDMANSLSVLSTGIRSALSYAVIGKAYKEGSILKINSEPSVSFQNAQTHTLTTDLGVDQIFFNGSAQVTPATGASASVRFDHAFWRLRLSWMARYGALVISNEPLTMINAGIGVLFRF